MPMVDSRPRNVKARWNSNAASSPTTTRRSGVVRAYIHTQALLLMTGAEIVTVAVNRDDRSLLEATKGRNA